MKIQLYLTTILIYTFLSFCNNANAQIEINYSDFAQQGDGFIYAVKHFKEKEINITDLEAAGWNFENYIPDSFDTVRFYPKFRTRYGKYFANAETVKFNSRTDMKYYRGDSSSIHIEGLIEDYLGINAAVVLIFPRDLTVYQFPLKKGNYSADSISQKFISAYGLTQFADSIRVDLDLTAISYFDTVAEIKTPTDKYYALREKNTIKKTITAYINDKYWGKRPAPQYNKKTKTIKYKWFVPKAGIPVVEIETYEDGFVKSVSWQYKQPMTIEIEKKDVTCKGKATGEATVKVSGGTPDYTYQWSNGARTKQSQNLTAGVYDVKVTDSKGIVKTESMTINEPQEELKLKVDVKHISCYGKTDGKLTAQISGGTTPYYTVWSNDFEGTELVNAHSGIYGVIVKDAGRCFIWDSVEVIAPNIPFSLNPIIINSPCKGENKGMLIANAKGGNEPYTVNFNNQPAQDTISNIGAGIYNLSAVDKYGCTLNREVTIREPETELFAQATIKNIDCKGMNSGSINLKISGGSPSYFVKWNNESRETYLRNLSPGNYSVEIKDSKGCLLNQYYQIDEPAENLGITIETQNVSCKNGENGSAVINVKGGTAPYNIVWSDKDNSLNRINLKAGFYNVKINDKNNCLITETVVISQPDNILTATSLKTDCNCYADQTGKIEISAQGGTLPYTYFINNTKTTPAINDLSAGVYKIKCVDANNCEYETSTEISQPVQPLKATVETQKTLCNGAENGQAIVEATGGTPDYEYQFSDGEQTREHNNMKAGNYSVKVSDSKGCSYIESFVIDDASPITINATITDSEPGKNNGKTEIIVNGGKSPYSIWWSDGNNQSKRKQLSPSTYKVTITDQNGCTAEKEFELK